MTVNKDFYGYTIIKNQLKILRKVVACNTVITNCLCIFISLCILCVTKKSQRNTEQ
jgi:hypothetical protein